MSASPKILLYELHWSHFCEKVRFALNYKKLDWKPVQVDPLSFRQAKHLKGIRKLTPLLEDLSTGKVLSDSTPILDYLESTYPEPPLFPGSEEDKLEIRKWCLEIDSHLGTAARRIGYGRIICEQPTLLTELFLKPWYPVTAYPILKTLSGNLMGIVLMQRYSMNTTEDDQVFQNTEQFLDKLLVQLQDRPFLVGNEFSAADITLATLIRPLKLVPYFRNNPKYDPLFLFHERIIEKFNEEKKLAYEDPVEKARKEAQHPTILRRFKNLLLLPITIPRYILGSIIFSTVHFISPPKKGNVKFNAVYQKTDDSVADNDHQQVTILQPKSWINGSALVALYQYFFEMPRNQKMYMTSKL